MKDWKTYAIIGLAVWCYVNTVSKDEEVSAAVDPAADVQLDVVQEPEAVVASATAEPVVTEKTAAEVTEKAAVAVAEVSVVAELSEEDIAIGKEYGQYKHDKHLKYLKLVKASRASWVAGNRDHKGFDYKVFLEQYAELKDYPTLLKSRLAALRADDPRLYEMVTDDLRRGPTAEALQ